MKQIKVKCFLKILTFVFLCLIPVIWFLGKGSALINGVDTNFPLDPVNWLTRRFFVWNSTANAGSDFSSSTAGLFFHLIQVVPFLLGFNLQLTQILSLVFWFSLIILVSYFLAKIIFPKKFLIQFLFVTLYSFNIYLFNSWENVKVANLSLVASLPLGIGLLILLEEREIVFKKAALYSFATGLVLSGAGINPSYFVSFILTMLIFSFSQVMANVRSRKTLLLLKNFLFVLFFITLANLFWLVPTLGYIFTNISPSGSIDKIGFTNWVQSLSENTSLLNTMRLQGAWDWYALDELTGLPFYIPYALNFFRRLPFLAYSFLITGLAIVSFLFRTKRKEALYLSGGLMFLTGVFLGAGTHLPTGILFSSLFFQIPFFTLFRSPWYIFTPMVFLSLTLLVSLFFDSLDGRLETTKEGLRLKPILYLILTIVIAGNFFYSYPLVTGKIFRPRSADSFFINFPNYVFDAKDFLQRVKGKGRIIGYPDDEIERFKWGFRGIESVLTLLVDSENLFSPLNTPDSLISQTIKEFYDSLKKRQISAASNLAAKLNIASIFNKLDQESLSGPLPKEISKSAPHKIGEWEFYEIGGDSFLPKIHSPELIYYLPDTALGVKMLRVLRPDTSLVNEKDSVVVKIPQKIINGRIFLAKNSQEEELKQFLAAPSILANRLKSNSLSAVTYSFDISREGNYAFILDNYQLSDFGLNLKAGMTLAVLVNGKAETLEVSSLNDSFVYFKSLRLNPGKYQLLIFLENKNLVDGGDFEKGETFEKITKGEFALQKTDRGIALSILNKGWGAPETSADFSVPSFDPLRPYYVELKYKQIYGNNASAILYQHTPTTLVKAQTERLPNYPEWNPFSFYFSPVKTESDFKVSLLAPFTADPLGTKVLYDDLAVYKVFTNNLLVLHESGEKISAPNVEFKKVNPSLYQAEVKKATGPHLIVFSENYSPGWKIALETNLGKKIFYTPLHFSANLFANGWYLEGLPENYRLKIYYRPQKLFNFSLILTGFSGAIVAYWNFRKKKRDV